MILSGTFKTINDDNSYTVTIGDSGTSVTITDPIEYNYANPPSTGMMFGPDPVEISCDRQDLTKRIIISQATIKLMSDSNLTSYLFAANNRSIPVTITRVQSNETAFFGYVDPLQFDQGYASPWEEIQISATDPLGALQDLTIGDLNGYNAAQERTPWEILTACLNTAGVSSITRNMNDIVYNAMTGTHLQMSVFFGSADGVDEDSYMTLYETLEEICKYFNLYISYYGGEAHVISTVNFSPTPNAITSFKTKATDSSTSISVDDVYSQVNVKCEIEPVPDIVTGITSSDYLYSDFNDYTEYMTELVATGEGKSAYNGFNELLTLGTTDYHRDDKSYGYALDNFVYIKKNDAWDFGPNGYTTLNFPKQVDYLIWLKEHPGKAMLVGFGRGAKRNMEDNSELASIDIDDNLVISICGQYYNTTSGANSMGTQIQNNNPICQYNSLSSAILSPPDAQVTNYLCITGNIFLNPLQPLTGPYPSDSGQIVGNWPWNKDNDTNNRAKLTNTIAMCTGNQGNYYLHTVPSTVNDDGQYYQQRWVTGSQGRTGIQAYGIYGNLDNSKNHMCSFQYNQFGDREDNISKLPILACSFCVGDAPAAGQTDTRKYCVERLDLGSEGMGKFEWHTLAECTTLGIEPYFTIGIDPKIGDSIIGQRHKIQRNNNYQHNLGVNGTAIPIKKSDALAGAIEFKILGPYNAVWDEVTRTKASFWNHSNVMTASKVILQNVQSIMISDFKIEAKSDNGMISEAKSNVDNDLIYASDMNPTYIDKLEESVKICTPLTLQECSQWGIKYQVSNSYVYNADDTPFFGFGENNVKPERCLVDYYYLEYNTPAKMLSTQMKADSFTNGLVGQKLTGDMMESYFTGIYSGDNGAYRMMKYNTSLKYKKTNVTFREYRTYNHTQI